MSEDFPTRGFAIVQPTIVENQLTGWIATAQFSRLGHTYAIKFMRDRAHTECLRDGKPVEWHKLNAKAKAVAHNAAKFLGAAAALRA